MYSLPLSHNGTRKTIALLNLSMPVPSQNCKGLIKTKSYCQREHRHRHEAPYKAQNKTWKSIPLTQHHFLGTHSPGAEDQKQQSIVSTINFSQYVSTVKHLISDCQYSSTLHKNNSHGPSQSPGLIQEKRRKKFTRAGKHKTCMLSFSILLRQVSIQTPKETG